jgi:hypothetical protein
MSRYATLADLKGYLGLGTETDQDFLLQRCIDSAEAAIDAYCRRSFVGTPGTVYANRYEGDRIRNNTFWLQEDLFSLTSLTLGDGQSVPVGASGSVWLQPREGPPYRGIQLKSAFVFTWNTDQDMIIAGTWGMGTIAPWDIQQATLEYATDLYRAKDITPNDQIGYEQGAGVTPMARGMPDRVRWKLSPYRSRSGGVV